MIQRTILSNNFVERFIKRSSMSCLYIEDKTRLETISIDKNLHRSLVINDCFYVQAQLRPLIINFRRNNCYTECTVRLLGISLSLGLQHEGLEQRR
jgi:hypothetical protein